MLYLIRHGTTDQRLRDPGDLTPASREEWEQDHGLSAAGRREAEALGARLARLDAPDRVLASPRRRTLETAQVAAPGRVPVIDERLHEWHGEESCASLLARVEALLQTCDEGVTWAFTHGGFIRAVVAALFVRTDRVRFEPVFHDLRRGLHVWNGSITLVGHGGSGLEVVATNLHHQVEALTGR